MNVQVRPSSRRADQLAATGSERTEQPRPTDPRRSYAEAAAPVTGRCPGTARHGRRHGGCMPRGPGRGIRCGRPCGRVTTWHRVRLGRHTVRTGPCRSPRWAPIAHAHGRAPCRSRAADECRAPARAGRHGHRSTSAPRRRCRGIPARGKVDGVPAARRSPPHGHEGEACPAWQQESAVRQAGCAAHEDRRPRRSTRTRDRGARVDSTRGRCRRLGSEQALHKGG